MNIADIITNLMWLSPAIWPECGKFEPQAKYRRHGLLAYADGVNWNPGKGEGIYRWNIYTSVWELATTDTVIDCGEY